MPQNSSFAGVWGETCPECTFWRRAHQCSQDRMYEAAHTTCSSAVPANGGKGGMGMGGQGCVPAARLGWLPGAFSTCRGTDSPQIWGMQREMCFHPKNGSAGSCAWGKQAPYGGAERELRWD